MTSQNLFVVAQERSEKNVNLYVTSRREYKTPKNLTFSKWNVQIRTLESPENLTNFMQKSKEYSRRFEQKVQFGEMGILQKRKRLNWNTVLEKKSLEKSSKRPLFVLFLKKNATINETHVWERDDFRWWRLTQDRSLVNSSHRFFCFLVGLQQHRFFIVIKCFLQVFVLF